MTRPVVFLCNPRHHLFDPKNQLDSLVHRTLYQASLGECVTQFGDRNFDPEHPEDFDPKKYNISPCVPCSSDLCGNFNKGWAMALGMREKYGVTHFAMVHADTTAQPGWLDIAVAEQQRLGCDRVNILIPYKNQFGISQVGLGSPSWPLDHVTPGERIRRLSLAEVHSYPKTFGVEHTPLPKAALLVDSGLWVCDITKPWAEKVCFKFLYDICKTSDGYSSLGRGEDYGLSLLMHAWGCKTYVTRKVIAAHWDGDKVPYANTPAWGEWQTDESWYKAAEAGDGTTDWAKECA